jgi:hypothetical protein
MGGIGNEISAQALGLNVANNDFFKQFVASSMGIDNTDNLQFNTDENGKIQFNTDENGKIIGAGGIGDEVQNRFQELVNQWNEIIEQSVNEFQSAN